MLAQAGQDEAIQWLFGLEGPALVLACLVIAGLVAANIWLVRWVRSLHSQMTDQQKEHAKQDRDTLENVLTVMGDVRTVFERNVELLHSKHDDTAENVKQCLSRLESIAADLRARSQH